MPPQRQQRTSQASFFERMLQQKMSDHDNHACIISDRLYQSHPSLSEIEDGGGDTDEVISSATEGVCHKLTLQRPAPDSAEPRPSSIGLLGSGLILDSMRLDSGGNFSSVIASLRNPPVSNQATLLTVECEI